MPPCAGDEHEAGHLRPWHDAPVHWDLDRFLDAYVRGETVAAAAARLGFAPEQVARVYRDIRQKRETTRYLHTGPLLVAPVALDGPTPADGPVT